MPLPAGLVAVERKTFWDRESGKVLTTEAECFGAIHLLSRNVSANDEEAVNALLQGVHNYPDLDILPWTAAERQFQGRVEFLSRVFPELPWPDISNSALSSTLSEWLAPVIKGMRSLAELKRLDMARSLQSLFTWEQLRRIDELAPTHITVPSGSKLKVDYTVDEPFLSVKLQEMFGLAETPAIAKGRVPVLLHLLSPARRPIQVTRDLRSFWESTYPLVKKELKGRYPKHPWPDDPWSAVPTRKTVKSAGRGK